ncbi:MAG: enoyl-CoA hydratase [Planctomycetota bacterium]|nr:MAG: enoyl-CoA hydratase [Planctomycetota bacterium]
MSYEAIIVEDHGPVRRITINRPEKLNALNRQVLLELRRAFEEADAEAAVRAVILTGAGERAFVAGADIAELARLGPEGAKEQTLLGQRILRQIEMMNKPVIAAINGYALGGGCELALACHLRVAAATAKIGLPEVKLGLIPGYGGTQRLPRLIGGARALELILQGEPIGADKALQWGLVNRVAPSAAETVRVAEELLRPILARAPLAVGAAIEAHRRGREVQQTEAMRIEADLFALLYTTEDTREGLTAFLDKREPKWRGR